jgi:hypothetical protein
MSSRGLTGLWVERGTTMIIGEYEGTAFSAAEYPSTSSEVSSSNSMKQERQWGASERVTKRAAAVQYYINPLLTTRLNIFGGGLTNKPQYLRREERGLNGSCESAITVLDRPIMLILFIVLEHGKFRFCPPVPHSDLVARTLAEADVTDYVNRSDGFTDTPINAIMTDGTCFEFFQNNARIGPFFEETDRNLRCPSTLALQASYYQGWIIYGPQPAFYNPAHSYTARIYYSQQFVYLNVSISSI